MCIREPCGGKCLVLVLILCSDLRVRQENEHGVCALGPLWVISCILHAKPSKMKPDLHLMRTLQTNDKLAQTPSVLVERGRNSHLGPWQNFHSLGLQGRRPRTLLGDQRPLLTTPILPLPAWRHQSPISGSGVHPGTDGTKTWHTQAHNVNN